MNRLLLLCCTLFTGAALWAQNQPNANVPMTLRQMTLDQKSWMMSSGFPISEYDYSSFDINMELSGALDDQKKGKLLSNISYGAVGLGTILLFAPTFIDDLEMGYGASTVFLLGGLTVNLVGMSKKIKAKKRVENARYLYYEKK